MPLTNISAYIRRYVRNQTSPPLIWNLFRHGNLAYEDDGKARRRDRRVGFLNLFNDLFLVAALGVFTSETDLSDGEKIGSYVIFFIAIWSIWWSQVVFDVRYGGDDALGLLWNLLLLCQYGILGAIAGAFHVGFNLGTYTDPRLDEDIPQWISPVQPILDAPSAVKRALKVASGVYAISRFLLIFQYLIVLVQAKKAGRNKRPAVYALAGLFISGCLFFAAMAVSWGAFGETRGSGIARVILWSAGWIIEYASSTFSAMSSGAVMLEQHYWTERFAALTLVVLGEGVLGIVESYRTSFVGPLGGYRPAIIAIVIAAVALYRVLFYLYFGDFSHTLRGNTLHHLGWGFLHLPMSLSLLLLTQTVVRNVRSINIWYSLDRWSRCLTTLDQASSDLTSSDTITVAQYSNLLINSDSGICLNRYSSALGIDRAAQIRLYSTIAGENITTFGNLAQAESYSLLLRLFSSNKFDPPREVYDKLNQYINEAEYNDELINDAFDKLVSVLYISSQGALTVMGGFLVTLAALSALQTKTRDKYTWLRVAGRAIIGTILLFCTLLNIGTTSYTSQSPMDNLLDNNWLVPVLLAAAAVVLLFDGAAFLFKVSDGKRPVSYDSASPEAKSMVESSDASER